MGRKKFTFEGNEDYYVVYGLLKRRGPLRSNVLKKLAEKQDVSERKFKQIMKMIKEDDICSITIRSYKVSKHVFYFLPSYYKMAVICYIANYLAIENFSFLDKDELFAFEAFPARRLQHWWSREEIEAWTESLREVLKGTDPLEDPLKK